VSHVDVVLVALLVPFALQGGRRGLCREGFALLGIVVGLIVVMAMAPELAARVTAAGGTKIAAFPMVLAAVVLVSMMISRIVGTLVARALREVFLGGVDHVAGVLFGALKGAASLGLILILLEQFLPSPSVQLAIEGSVLGPPLMRVAGSLLEVGRGLGGVASHL
jgi:membrane protein required for colicin V production